MRKMIFAAAALAFFAAMPASAGVSTNGYVTGFLTLGSNVVLVFTDGSRSGVPGCSSPSYPNRWAFDVTTPTGQAMLSILLTARATHEPVAFHGTGTCSLVGDAETLSLIITNNAQ